jgi:3-oxoacyl-[acyl-carrier protein] reductase
VANESHPFSLAGRIALVTAGSRGIGAAIARALGRAGAVVAVNYHRSAADASNVVADVIASGPEAIALQADITNVESVAAMVDGAVAAFGGIDLLVHNAFGSTTDITWRPALESAQTVEAIRNRTATQLGGALHCCRLVVPHMRNRSGGSITFISASGSRNTGVPGGGEVLVAKAALDAVVRTLAVELGPDGIRVNTVAPGMVPTDANAGVHQHALIKDAESRTPLGQVSTPEDVADVVVAFASDATRQVTGAYLPTDGGRVML